MEEMQQITLDQWLAWKEDIREKLRETAGNFVHIGFRLKQIRDSGMLDGADDIFEFALNEYGLSKSTTSRFIAINEKFSEGGNSLELREEYRAIGSSKLAEMLTLTDAECKLITERTTVKEIRELKNFSRQQASEVETGAEGGAQEGSTVALTPLQKCLADYFKDKKEMLNAVIEAVHNIDYKAAAELMNPSGYGTHKKGICFMFMYDFNAGVKVKLLTEPEPREMPWPDVLLELYKIFGDIFESGEEDVYKAYYSGQEKAPDEMSEKKPEEAAGEEPEIDYSETEETAENQNAEGIAEDSVATSQQEEKADENADNASARESLEESAEEIGREAEEREPDEELEINVSEMEETAENQNAEGVAEDSVATSQQTKEPVEAADGDGKDTTWDDVPEDDPDLIICQQREKIARAKTWIQIENAEDAINTIVLHYNQNEAADREIPFNKLKEAYKLAIDLAAGLESLILDAEKGGYAGE